MVTAAYTMSKRKDVDGYVSCEGAWLRAKTDLILFDLIDRNNVKKLWILLDIN
jgi:hypothetical protein